MSERDSNGPSAPRRETGPTWRILGMAAAGALATVMWWGVTKTSADIEAIRMEFSRKIEQFQHDRVSDLTRITAIETKLDSIRDTQARQDAKLDKLLESSVGSKRR